MRGYFILKEFRNVIIQPIKKSKMKQTMQTHIAGIFMVIFFAFISCNSNSSNSASGSDTTNDTTSANTKTSTQQHAEATLQAIYPDTALTGKAVFDEQAGNKVKMNLQLSIPSKAGKSVAVHIHEHADCGDMGKAAGGHWNPTNAQHGKWGSNSFHSGDIGNVKLDMKGNGSLDLETDLWSLGGDSSTNILNKTIIVHGGEDDFMSQPSGNSGERIGCGVIQ
jgi:Cu-Zn family superoxide dismutase